MPDALLVREREDGKLELIDGHLRAETTPDMVVPVLVVDLTEAEAKRLLVHLDPLAGMAQVDDTALKELLADIGQIEDSLAAELDTTERWLEEVMAGGGEEVDGNAEWEGMPEFEQEDKTAHQSLHMHFKDQASVDAFSRLIAQRITAKTRSAWYPAIEIERYADKRYADES